MYVHIVNIKQFILQTMDVIVKFKLIQRKYQMSPFQIPNEFKS